MEEILASIRLIISDDAKRGPVERDEIRAFHSPAPRNDAPPAQATAEEEVFDLTEELVFPEDQHKAVAAPAAETHAAEPAPDAMEEEAALEEPPQVSEHAPGTSHEPAVEVATAPEPPAVVQPEHRFQPAARPDYSVQRQEAPNRPSQTHSRPIWSRRELPGSPPPVASSSPRAHEGALSRQPQSRSWADDIQMPIPDRGPVPLISTGETQAQIKEPSEANRAAAEIEAYSAAAVRKAEALLDSARAAVNAEGVTEEGLGEKEEVAVAAVAESLARSAASALDCHELASASDVDFARLDEERKTEVAETFADAIKRETAPRESNPLPTLLDEVLRAEFTRAPEEAPEIPEAATIEENAEAVAETYYSPARDEPPALEWPAETQAEELVEEQPAAVAAPVPPSPRVVEAIPEKPSLAQAQFLGALQPAAPAPGIRSLEDAVRDMLRPLLVQWLNDNMPRILESAIREEIATRGLLPKSNG
jgi:cell pole-organizing protein PopZ